MIEIDYLAYLEYRPHAVVQRVDNFVHWIVRYPADNINFNICPRFSR